MLKHLISKTCTFRRPNFIKRFQLPEKKQQQLTLVRLTVEIWRLMVMLISQMIAVLSVTFAVCELLTVTPKMRMQLFLIICLAVLLENVVLAYSIAQNELSWPQDLTPPFVLPADTEPVAAELVPELKASACSVQIRGAGIKNPAPLFIKPGTAEFYPLSATGSIDVAADKSIEFHCSRAFMSPLPGSTLLGTCVGGTRFRINSHEYDISSIRCTAWPEFVAKKSGKSCNGGTALIYVGFQLDNSRFLKQYEVCFNEHAEVTRYIYHTLEMGSNYYATGIDRISFTTAGFFNNKNVDVLYTQKTQKQTIDQTLGYDAGNYFNSNRNIFLARGHMAAKADFVFGAEQRATFLFINSAPQWQTFNAGNWASVEDSLRVYGTKHKKFLQCWTGVYGVTTLPNTHGQATPLYLAYDHNGNGLIPVPKLYFRVVIEPATKKGIVLVGVNNPHLSLNEIRQSYILCNDVSDRINYITWRKTDILAGYSYACEVNEFRKRVTYLPDFSVNGLLL